MKQLTHSEFNQFCKDAIVLYDTKLEHNGSYVELIVAHILAIGNIHYVVRLGSNNGFFAYHCEEKSEALKQFTECCAIHARGFIERSLQG